MRRARAPRSTCCKSRQQWVQAQTDYSRSRYDYMMNVIKLQQAAGILSEQSLQRINALLTDSPLRTAERCRRQPRLNEREQARDAAAVRCDDLLCRLPRCAAVRRDRRAAA